METTSTSIRLPNSIINELDMYAHKLGISRNQLMNNLLSSGLDDLRLLNRTGFLLMGHGYRQLVEAIRDGKVKVSDQDLLPL
jgi:metal-responsive CopG/Arc/MetJ family transcriptional regulator